MSNYNDYSIDSYGAMIRDQRRMAAFSAALQRAVTPGCVVLDIGAATGIFSFLACQFGAARVYAVEPDSSIEVARACAKGIPGAERITWIQGLSTEIDLPEKVDVVVGDLHGVLPFFKGNLESLSDARKRHLKPGGTLIPSRDVLYAVPAHAPHEYLRLQKPWQENDFGIDFSPSLRYVANTWWRADKAPAQPENLLASPQCWGEVPYATADITAMEGLLTWDIERAGILHGLYVWFDGDLGAGIGYSNAPQLSEMVYGRAFFPLGQAVQVLPGDKLTTHLTVKRVKGDHIYRWKSQVQGADGRIKASFDQSTFKARLIPVEQLRKAAVDYVPAITAEGEVLRFILDQIAQALPLKDIAVAVASTFPAKFANTDLAMQETVKVAQKYG